MASRGTFQKGLGTLTTPGEIASIAKLGWNLLREDLSLPAAVLVNPHLEHNLRWMAAFARRYGVELAPHGKTTMAPALFHRQLAAGAWGITLATAHQCAVAHAHGIHRILMANQLLGPANCNIISTILAQGATVYTLVDSADLVHHLGSHFRRSGQTLRVLVELGVEGGRTGVRTGTQLQSVLDAITQWPGTLQLCGVELYEGVLKSEPEVRHYVQHAAETLRQLVRHNLFHPAERPIVSGAGSAWYDVVADVLAPLRSEADVLLRPGCYLTSDAGIYRVAQQQISQRNSIAQQVDTELGGSLRSAIELWAYVQSRPEPGLAIVGLGKRDAAFDAGLPHPLWHLRPEGHGRPTPAPPEWVTRKLMDQHLYLDIPSDADLRVGDRIAFEISHPCLTFDKWRYLLLRDADYNILEAIPTFF